MYGRREDFQTLTAFKLYDHFGPTLESKPLPREHEIYNFGRGLTDLYHYAFRFSNRFVGGEKIF